MNVIRDLSQLRSFLEQNSSRIGSLADTGFLYALAYNDDRCYERANDVHDLLSENQIDIFTNVISRMEFIDLIFRKQVTLGCLEVYKNIRRPNNATIVNTFKDIRDQETAARRCGQSYKVDEGKLKKLRHQLIEFEGFANWKDFCETHIGDLLVNEWAMIEDELGLRFIEVMDGATSELFNESLRWPDMVRIMADYGLRGPDAMIVNLFVKSKFPLFITTDADFEACFADPLGAIDLIEEKTIFLL